MSVLVEVQDRIQSTIARITELEKVARESSAPASVRLNIRGLEKLLANLEADFARYAHDEELQICRYRLLPPQGARPTISAISRAWAQYQALFSSVYDAVKHRNEPKRRRTRKDAKEETQFGFAYTYSGSVGVVLTLPARETDYFRTRIIAETASTILELTQAQTPERLAHFVERLGVPPVAKLGTWVDAHVAFGAGAGIEWDFAAQQAPALLVQFQELSALKEAMQTITKPIEEETPVSGLLVAADMEKRTFRMRLDAGERISGRFVDAISQEQRAELPQRYTAIIRTTTIIKPAIEKREVKRFLVQLVQKLPI